MLEGGSPLSGIIPFYGDRSYETLADYCIDLISDLKI